MSLNKQNNKKKIVCVLAYATNVDDIRAAKSIWIVCRERRANNNNNISKNK